MGNRRSLVKKFSHSLFPAVALTLVSISIFTPVLRVVIDLFDDDYSQHYEMALRLSSGEIQHLPHFLYHTLLVALTKLSATRDDALLVLSVGFRVLLGLVIFFVLSAQVSRNFPSIWRAVIVILFLLISPLYFQVESPYLIGYLSHLVYHSPTQNLMLLFVIPVSLLAMRAVVRKPFSSLNQRVFFTALSASLVMLMTLSKPSYLIALLPALGLAVLYRLVRRLPVDWWLLSFGLGLPSIFMLAFQYVVAYGDPENTSLQMGLLAFFRAHGLQVWDVVARHLVSIIFPLSAYLLHAKHAAKDDYLNFSWLVFGVSLIWSSFFHESGSRLMHGNFVWTAHAALFVLMFSTILFLLKHYAARAYKLGLSGVVSLVAFELHVLWGIRLYLAMFAIPPQV